MDDINYLLEYAENGKQEKEDFMQMYAYIWSNSILSLRQELNKKSYPALASSTDVDSVVSICLSIYRMQHIHHEMAKENVEAAVMDPVLQELCRPIVERIRYHFIPHESENQRMAAPATRIERLPELLLGYVRENIFEKSNGSWELVCLICIQAAQVEPSLPPSNLSRILCIDFVNEMIRMIQWVLMERNFFRHPDIAGAQSKPIHLMQAIEQLLQFDLFVKAELQNSFSDNEFVNLSSRKVISLTDACVLGDEELMNWWLEREREYIFSVLFDAITPVTVPPKNVSEQYHRISPRAELFCSLWRSLQMKANVFSFQGPYLSSIVAPVCVQFLDSIHSAATTLRTQLLSTQRNQYRLPTNKQLLGCICQWIQLINGTHMVSTMLTTFIVPSETEGDTKRFGQSLERLHSAILDDLIEAIVEVMIMERAKFAGYLMRCSFLLVNEKLELIHDDTTSLSLDLYETNRILSAIVNYCTDCDYDLNIHNQEQDSNPLYAYAPRTIRERLLSSMAEKFVEVALNINGMTPDLRLTGCMIYARDVTALLVADDKYILPESVLRVLDVVTLMQYDSPALRKIGNTLCQLSGQSAPLEDATFEADDKLYEEAISMIRAKGLVHLDLSDVLAVLNRRRDL